MANWLWGIVESALGIPLISAGSSSNAACIAVGLFLGPEFCESKEGEPNWLPIVESPAVKAVLIGAGILAGAIAVGAAVYYLGQVPVILEQDLGVVGDFFLAPLRLVKNSWGWFWGGLSSFNDWVSEKTMTIKPLWVLLESLLVLLGMVELAKSLVEWAAKQSLDSYLWRIFFTLVQPVEWVHDFWEELFPGKWNPMRILGQPFYWVMKSYVFLLSGVVNIFNPLRWIQLFNKA